MKISDKIDHIISSFNAESDWEDKYRLIIKRGKSLLAIPEELKEDKFKIQGCQSQVWLIPSFTNGKVIFKADSDSTLVKGIIEMLVYVYSDEKPEDILNTPADFLENIGMTQQLSMNRTNGLRSMIKQIKMYALTYQALGQR